MKSWFGAGLLLALLCLGAGCSMHKLVVSQDQKSVIRERSKTQFTRAFYLKPSPMGSTNEQVLRLAPLLVVEAGVNKSEPPSGLSVHFRMGSTVVNRQRLPQITYCWERQGLIRGTARDLSVQGVRMTLDHAGSPIVWEALTDSSGARVMFVSQSLEAQATRSFGKPGPGNTYAVERHSTEAPDVVVARVIEDGPLPLGPIVYVRAAGGDLVTVNCRCMDSQARELAGMAEYQLTPLPRPATRTFQKCLRRTSIQGAVTLADSLRFPGDY